MRRPTCVSRRGTKLRVARGSVHASSRTGEEVERSRARPGVARVRRRTARASLNDRVYLSVTNDVLKLKRYRRNGPLFL